MTIAKRSDRRWTVHNSSSYGAQKSQAKESAFRQSELDLESIEMAQDDDRMDERGFFPPSTYSLLFTADIFSIPFAFAVLSTALCYICICLSLYSLLVGTTKRNPFNVPANVPVEVRVTQFVAIVVGILMEEEIPEAIYLVRAFSKKSLKEHVPRISYTRFIISALCRVVNGYLFLAAVFLVIVQASEVLPVFYDMLALQFVQSIDDVTFSLAKKDFFGVRLFEATNKEFSVRLMKKGSCYKRSFLIKFMYTKNFIIMLILLTSVQRKQNQGVFISNSLWIDFGEVVWNDAWLKFGNEEHQRRNLNFASFSGVYKVNGTVNGYPRYQERSKVNGDAYGYIEPAEIIYCSEMGRWAFRHPNIYKEESDHVNSELECNWLVKSYETSEFDLNRLDHSGWNFWTGSIQREKTVHVLDNYCSVDTDCNNQGECIEESCHCENGYTGAQCQHPPACKYLKDDSGTTWTMAEFNGTNLMRYDKYIYFQNSEATNSSVGTGSILNNLFGISAPAALAYTGSRWEVGNPTPEILQLIIEMSVVKFNKEFHTFWMPPSEFILVSERTESSTPVGIDFSAVMPPKNNSKDDEYGPYGRLKPLAQYPGDGFFHCLDEITASSTKPGGMA